MTTRVCGEGGVKTELAGGKDEREAVGVWEVRMDGVQRGEREKNLSGTKDLQD